jgi:hypothetical protein
MALSTWSCLSTAPIAWLGDTALNHFATPHHSILLQGQVPQKVMLSGDQCNQQTFQTGIWLDSYGERSWERGWFKLQTLEHNLRTESATTSGCALMLTSGWHQTEANGKYWWRWSDGRDPQLQVLMARDATLMFQGAMESFQIPNQVDVFLNDVKVSSLTINWYKMRGFKPIALQLHAGKNVIRLLSHNPPIEYDNRELAINVGGLTLSSDDEALACKLRQ